MTETDVVLHGLFRYPISTAPRDGTEVLLFQRDDVDFGVWEWFAPDDGWEGGFGWSSNRGFIEEPDAWCPVPKLLSDVSGSSSDRLLRDHHYCNTCQREVLGSSCRQGHAVVHKPAEYLYAPASILTALQAAVAAVAQEDPAKALAEAQQALAGLSAQYLDTLIRKTEAKFPK